MYCYSHLFFALNCAYYHDELKANQISMAEIFEALENNNQNTGGAYIEKNHYANFIRGEGLARSLEDIENIRLIWRLGLLAGSTPPDEHSAIKYIRRQVRAKQYNG